MTSKRFLASATVISLTFVVACCTGCGGAGGGTVAVKAQAAFVGPHGGATVPLADLGFVEIVSEYDGRGKNVAARLAAYFFAADRTSSLTPPPTDVSLTVKTPAAPDGVNVALKQAVDPKNKNFEARFVSQPGAFEFDEMRGELTAVVDGKSITAPWSFGP